MTASASFEHIALDVDDVGVATITLDRPDRLNAYTYRMGRELGEAYARCDEDDGVRVVIVTGAGRAFCAGADMGGGDETFEDITSEGGRDVARGHAPRRLAAFEVRKPVLAAMNGHAVGIGMTLAMQCDLRLAAHDAKLAFAFVRRGIVAELGTNSILPRVVGFSGAADLLLSGRTITGAEAAALGLVSESLPAGEVVARARAWAEDVATNAAPVSVALTKRLLWEGVTESVDETMAKEVALLERVGTLPDAREGVRSFLERRPPEWQARVSDEVPPVDTPTNLGTPER